MERILDVDGYALDPHGVDGGRVDYLGAEVAQLHSLVVRELVYGVSIGDDARVGRHEAVHVRPDLKGGGIERRGDDGSGVVGASAAEVGRLAVVDVAGYEARDDCHLGHTGKSLAHQP